MESNRKTILLVHHDLSSIGGATAVAAWMIQALKDDFDLTVLTWRSFDAEVLNRFLGTSIRRSDLAILKPNPIVRAILSLDRDHGSIQPVAYLMRTVQKLRRKYDLVIASGTEEMDLGGRGLVYIHFPHLARFWDSYRDCEGLGPFSKLRALINGETRPWIVLADYSLKRFKQATLVANSDWTGDNVKRFYQLSATTLYPPVSAYSVRREWMARENAFLCLGRFTAPKRMDSVISILSRVREQHPDMTLHLTGPRHYPPRERDYNHKLQAMVDANRDWITIHHQLSRKELLKLMGRVRYGIHANRDEHFGIAPAEMMVSGCIVFVHNSGGQVEIVGRDPRICYTNEEDAAVKIAQVVCNPALQASILEALAHQQPRFSPEQFMHALRAVVDQMIAED